jgi:hypothetical protein
MIDPSDIDLVRGGGSSESPARDYIVVGGTSSTDERDYIILLGNRLLAQPSTIAVISYGNFWLDKYKYQHETSVVSIGSSPVTAPWATESGTIQIGSGPLTATLIRELTLLPSTITLASGVIDQWGTESGTIQIGSGQLTAILLRDFAPPASIISVGSGAIDQWSLQSGELRLSSTAATLVYSRQVSLITFDLGIYSSITKLYFNTLESASVLIGSSATQISPQLSMQLLPSTIEISSPQAVLKNNFLVGFSSQILIGSGRGELRRILTGYLPPFAPTNMSFEAPRYGIERVYAMSGGATRKLMCSRPSNAMLTIDYENISDVDARRVADAYDESYGERYGFFLPDELLASATPAVANYIRLTGTLNKWYFEERPVIQSVFKGVSTLTVQLKSRIDLP